jgi:hypothetical protein
MRLYFNGCSHTYGDDLADPASAAWPTLVGNHYNCDFLNDSMSGGTNDRIMYRAIKQANQFDKFYIAWTYTSRFTRYRSDNNFGINFNIQLTNTSYNKDPTFLEYGKIHYAVWHNELYAFKLWLQNIILLQRFFESIKKPYLMLNSVENYVGEWTAGWDNFNNSVKSLLCFDLMNDDQLYSEHLEIQQLLSQINFDHYIGWNTRCLTTFLSEYPVGVTKHLLEDGHKATAEYIIQHDTN